MIISNEIIKLVLMKFPNSDIMLKPLKLINYLLLISKPYKMEKLINPIKFGGIAVASLGTYNFIFI